MLSKFLKRNEHPMERVARVAIGVGLLACVVVGPQTWWGLFGLVPLITGFTGVCPLYSVLGINTCQVPRNTTVM